RNAFVARDQDRHLLDMELRALDARPLRDEVERECERVDDNLAEPPHREVDARDAAPVRVSLGYRNDRLGERELLHQQILPTPPAAPAERRLEGPQSPRFALDDADLGRVLAAAGAAQGG